LEIKNGSNYGAEGSIYLSRPGSIYLSAIVEWRYD